ncbi:MAG: GTPase ObgE [Candidatus Saccharibacteria bacterium]|nr:GTPase ObgE [Candidatus Saccharibacteria bacterium]
MFVDTAKVELHAGKGGDGAVSFRHEIYIPKGGPDGGDGGRGGSIIFRADKDTNTLLDFRFTPILRAEDGKNGSGTRSAGRSGKDLIVEVPVGTVVYRVNNESFSARSTERGSASSSAEKSVATDFSDASAQKTFLVDLDYDGAEAVIARGGDGGFGNAHFKSSTRQTPQVAEVGEPGEEFIAELELKLLADVGLVGLPNAGKSTFLSVVSNATPEIADYPFTTITPNLGVATIDETDLLIADIPGLIEGAADGKGLGHAFLRHVDRTAVLLHLVDAYSDDAGKAYKIIRGELEKYSDLANRREIVALTKCEGLDKEILDMQIAAILRENPDAKIYCISSAAHQGLQELLRALKEAIGGVKAAEQISRDSTEPGKASTSAFSSVVADENDTLRGNSYLQALPTISLSQTEMKDTWHVEKTDDGKFVVTGEKIEKFARRTDMNNWASVNRLRDILKKMGIRAELTSQGAEAESIISIAGKEFTLVEDW